MKAIKDMTPEEQANMPYPELCKLRRAEWQAHVDQMTVRPEIKFWEKSMINEYGPTIAVGRNRVSPLVGLMVVRYGEAIWSNVTGKLEKFWPDEFSDADVQRANDWITGKRIPDKVIWATQNPGEVHGD